MCPCSATDEAIAIKMHLNHSQKCREAADKKVPKPAGDIEVLKKFVGADKIQSHLERADRLEQIKRKDQDLQHIIDLGANQALIDEENELKEAELKYKTLKKQFQKDKAAVRKEMLSDNAGAFVSDNKEYLDRQI